MAEFSVSYAGLEDAYNRLYATYSKIAGISSDIYQASRKVSGAKSLANKGYYEKIAACARNASTTAERVKVQSVNILEIGQIYSRAEKRVLSNLNDRVTAKAGFSEESAAIAGKALANHQSPEWTSFGQSLKESVIDRSHDLMNLIDEFRYWRSTTGRKWIEKYMSAPVFEAFFGKYNKSVEKCEKLVRGVLNPTNPSAVKDAADVFAGEIGLGEYVNLYNRYSGIEDAVHSRAQRELEKGNMGKYLATYFAGSTLTFGQMAVDSVATGVKIVADKATGGMYSKAVAPLDKVFASWGTGLRKLVDSI